MADAKYLFDTDTITNFLKPRPSRTLFARTKYLAKEQQFISTVSIGEIIYGAMKSSRAQYHIDRLQNELLPIVHVLPFDATAAFQYGQLRASQERAGKPLCLEDLQIAAIATANDCVLVTGNTRHFKMIPGLVMENWL